MKSFLAIFLGTKASFEKWQAQDENTRKNKEREGMQSWGNWMVKYEKQIEHQGGPLGKTKRIGPSGISDIRNELAAFTVFQAESHEEAAKMFLNHPHFTCFPGDSVEVMECLPIPTMKN